RQYYDVRSKSYKDIPGQEKIISLANIAGDKILWSNSGTTIKDLGDGIINIEFHTKMNTIGGEVLQGLNKAMDIAEKDYRGLIISNEGQNFSAGANVGMIFMLAVEQEFDELDIAVKMFQNTTTRLRHCSVPVVAAPHGLTLGGGCEICLHVDKVVAHAETYMGLVEFGVGLIPGGGGTKEFALRLADELHDGDMRVNQFRNRFLTIGQAKVSTSGEEAFELGYMRRGQDEVVVSREHQLSIAKEECLIMADEGYTAPAPRKDIEVLGNEAMGIVYIGAHSMMSGNYISEHDKLISEKLGHVLAGGDLTTRSKVSEKYLLDLERRKFLELCGERKTLERLQSIITTGKVLRN
ncbi:MAG: enoyl-CoA hydratase/isomerase family protein, partial [Flavobacteriales bacterium]|nr:enoyl-CoA hydratase/isomerase family protein [Flavobacteriales bacterium]